MSFKLKDEPHCGMTDLQRRMVERVRKRPMYREEKLTIEEATESGECDKCGHPKIDWLYAWLTPSGDLIHVCNARGQQQDRLGVCIASFRKQKHVHPSWLLLDLTEYTLESP